jgi:NTE family protein
MAQGQGRADGAGRSEAVAFTLIRLLRVGSMSVKSATKTTSTKPKHAFECVALLLQGGGALGAYQAGVYEALAEAGVHPDWVAGISIGAINAAIISGNPPEERVAKLRQFWQLITNTPSWDPFGMLAGTLEQTDAVRAFVNQVSAGSAVFGGAPGFFRPRWPPPWPSERASVSEISFYDTSELKGTLERLVDFDRINAKDGVRLSVGAVNVKSGNFAYFDSTTGPIRAEHVMASGALPPGLPAVEVEGDYYWDGGLISNSPLQWVVLQSGTRKDTLAFQVDLWSARGALPSDLAEVATRQKEIQYSSRTRANTDQFKQLQDARVALADFLATVPDELKTSPQAKILRRMADHKVYNIVHLIYRSKHYEGNSKDYEFSRRSMEDHWRAGYEDAVRTLKHPRIFERPRNHDGVATFDLTQDEEPA